MRPSFDEVAFNITRSIAQRSTCPRLHTAAVIMTSDHRLVASGYNGSLPGLEHCSQYGEKCSYCKDGYYYTGAGTGIACTHCHGTNVVLVSSCLVIDGHCQRTVHAEANAIAQAAKYGPSIEGCHIYVLHQPCLTCTKLIVASGIVAIHYDQEYRADDETSRLAVNLMAESHVSLYTGVK
jgi:dCMP deaminase